jgi:oxygen-independent coproporphyrinogen-3 oxidase
MLDAEGIHQYEISNFAREGHESQHNLKYWKRQPYIGFGLDAHSMLYVEGSAVRFQNTDDLDVYMGDRAQGVLVVLPHSDCALEPELVRREAAFEESLFLGLRLNEGVDLKALCDEFDDGLVMSVMPAVQETCEAGLIEMDGDCIRLTARGRMASNEVFSRLLVSAAV